jgi:hypothetical protein
VKKTKCRVTVTSDTPSAYHSVMRKASPPPISQFALLCPMLQFRRSVSINQPAPRTTANSPNEKTSIWRVDASIT